MVSGFYAIIKGALMHKMVFKKKERDIFYEVVASKASAHVEKTRHPEIIDR